MPLDRLLTINPDDAGCEQTWALVDVYVETVVSGGDPEAAFPGIGAHLQSCGPCLTDYTGLVTAVRTDDPGQR